MILYGTSGFTSYKDGILTTISNNYKNTTYASSARHLGMPVTTTNSGDYMDATPNSTDTEIMASNSGLRYTGGSTFSGGWEAWQNNSGAISNGSKQVIVYNSIGVSTFGSNFFSISMSNGMPYSLTENYVTAAVRPIITLKSTVDFSSGSGTQADPFVLGTIRTITYNANGGSNAPAAQKALSGVATTVTLGRPTRSGMVLASWNTASNGSGTSYSPGQTITVTANTTLYAQWETATTYYADLHGILNHSPRYSTWFAGGNEVRPSAMVFGYVGNTVTLSADATIVRDGVTFNFAGWEIANNSGDTPWILSDPSATTTTVTVGKGDWTIIEAIYYSTTYNANIPNIPPIP